MQNKRIIGTKYLAYSEKRNICLDFPRYEVRRAIDPYTYLAAAHLRLHKSPNQRLLWFHDDFGLSQCVGFHFWNAVSASNKPWVTTLELPYTDEMRLKYLASKQCKQIFCLSSWVMNFENRFLEKSQYSEQILPKLRLLHPPQKINISQEAVLNKKIDTCRFLFIGRDFFRKGGYECIKAFTKILQSKSDAELIMVSDLTVKDYPIDASQEELDHALQLIDASQGKIKVLKHLPHDKVMELISTCHVGLLPTYNDSYGYSILEFFSYGLPVITTNVYAMAEINDENRGWVLTPPLVDTQFGLKEFDRSSPKKRAEVSSLLTDLLWECLEKILKQPSTIQDKGLAALNYIDEFHQPSYNIQLLEDVYDRF